MPARSKVLRNRTIRGEEALRVPGRLEPLHPSLPVAGRLMGVLRPVVQVAVLAMFHPREDLALRRAVALELIRDNHKWTPQEVKQLQKLADGNTPTRLIAHKLGRTEDAVRAKAGDEDISLKPTNQSPYNRRNR